MNHKYVIENIKYIAKSIALYLSHDYISIYTLFGVRCITGISYMANSDHVQTYCKIGIISNNGIWFTGRDTSYCITSPGTIFWSRGTTSLPYNGISLVTFHIADLDVEAFRKTMEKTGLNQRDLSLLRFSMVGKSGYTGL
jgi:hypothetical protein